MSEHLEMPLWETLRSAQIMPEEADLNQLLAQIEGAIANQPEREQLELAGESLLRVAELCALRAEVLLTQWEEAYRDPIVETEFFADVVRQTMAVDLSELMEPAPPRRLRTKRNKPNDLEEGSIVATVDKAAVLEMVDQMEQEAEIQKQQVLAIAYEENVSSWVEAIAQVLKAAIGNRVSFVQLCQSVELPRVVVWLGLLLGSFELQQEGEFYSLNLWVSQAFTPQTQSK